MEAGLRSFITAAGSHSSGGAGGVEGGLQHYGGSCLELFPKAGSAFNKSWFYRLKHEIPPGLGTECGETLRTKALTSFSFISGAHTRG